MRLLRKLSAVALGGSLLAVAGTAAAAPGDPWQPKNDLFHLNYRFAGLALLLVAAGIAVGLFASGMFRYQRVRLISATGQVQRHSGGHMLTHWLNAVGFLLALFTGAVMLKWLPISMPKLLLYTLHYIGAGCILVGFVATVVHAATKGTSSVHRLIPTKAQVREALFEALSYTGLIGDRGILGFRKLQFPVAMRRDLEQTLGFQGLEQSGKYLAAEEVLSYPLWALVGLVIISTGVLKAANYGYHLAPGVVLWITRLHDWATVGTVVMLIVHVGALVLVRTNWPLLRSMFTGKVEADYVKEAHGEWYHELVEEAERGGRSVPVKAKARPVLRKGH